jgi:hypothetical protein
VPAHTADQSSSRNVAVAAPGAGAAPAAVMPALPGRSADGNGDDLAATPVRSSRATATDPDGVTGTAPSVNGAYIYGYDVAGNPTLTDAGYYRSSDGKLPD